MYLRTLTLKNLKLVRSFEWSFEREAREPRKWTVFIGQNGVCKTTILRAIAMAATALMTGSDIYRTFFGIDRLYPVALGEDLRRYSFLVGKPLRTDEEEAEMLRLQRHLADHGVDKGPRMVFSIDLRASALSRSRSRSRSPDREGAAGGGTGGETA